MRAVSRLGVSGVGARLSPVGVVTMSFYQLVSREMQGSLGRLVFVSAMGGLSTTLFLPRSTLARRPRTKDRQLWGAGLFIIALLLFIQAQHYILITTTAEIGAIIHKMRVRLMDYVRRSELLPLEAIGRAEIVAAITMETATLTQASNTLAFAAQNGLLIVLVTAYVAYLSFLAFVLSVVIVGVGAAIFHSKTKQHAVQMREASLWDNRLYDRRDGAGGCCGPSVDDEDDLAAGFAAFAEFVRFAASASGQIRATRTLEPPGVDERATPSRPAPVGLDERCRSAAPPAGRGLATWPLPAADDTTIRIAAGVQHGGRAPATAPPPRSSDHVHVGRHRPPRRWLCSPRLARPRAPSGTPADRARRCRRRRHRGSWPSAPRSGPPRRPPRDEHPLARAGRRRCRRGSARP